MQDLIAHESGLWAVAAFLEEKLGEYVGHPLTGGAGDTQRSQLPMLLGELGDLLYRNPINQWTAASVRQLVMQLERIAAESGLPGCDMPAFLDWLYDQGETEYQVAFSLAAIEEVLRDFSWNPSPDIKELESLQRALPANWGILKGLREQATSGMMGVHEDMEAFEKSVTSMITKIRSLLANYGEA